MKRRSATVQNITVLKTLCTFAFISLPATTGATAQTLPVWATSPAPVISIGTVDGDEHYLLEEVAGVIRTRDGRFIIADGQRQVLRTYDANGKHMADWGRAGSGPGEYRILQNIRPYRADSIVSYDWRAKRITVMDGRGKPGRTIIVPLLAKSTRDVVASEVCCRLTGAMRDGSFVMEIPEMVPQSGSGVIKGTKTYVRLSPDGTLRDTIAIAPASEHRISGGRVTQLDYGPRIYAAVVGDDLIYGNGAGSFYSVVRNKSHARTVAVPLQPIAVTPSIRKAIDTDRRMRFARGPSEGTLDSYLSTPIANTLPTYSRLHADVLGNIWLRGSTIPGSTAPLADYVVMGPAGAPVARVRLPIKLWIMWIDRDSIVGIEWDESNVPFVKAYTLRRGRTEN